VLARKSVKQGFVPPSSVSRLMRSFRLMCNDAIRIGLAADASSLKRLSKLSYGELKKYDDIPGYYKLCAISKASGILASRKKTIRRGFPTKQPYLSKPILVSCYGFKIDLENRSLLVPLGDRLFESIPLNAHTLTVLSQPGATVRSFTTTERSLSLCIAKEVEESPVEGMVGVDRNLRNVTAGNAERLTYYDVTKIVEITETTRRIVRSFKRNDVRIRMRLAAKYGQRNQERVRQILNRVSKNIVTEARRNKRAIAFEEIGGIRKLYRKGNGQRKSFRGLMNSWPFHELKRQVEYKAAWEGVPVVTLSVKETKGTTMDCPRCGERLQAAIRGDARHHRQLWCQKCERWEDRDLVAVLNISRRGWVRFAQSKGEGEAGEAVKRNETRTLILRVDASKLSHPAKT
jgi:putative transposase